MAARSWFRLENTSDLTKEDLAILNRAMRSLVDNHNLSPTSRWLMEVRTTYKPGMSARALIDTVNAARHSALVR